MLHESSLDKRTQYMIEVMFQVRKDGFKDNPSVPEELDLVEEDDQFTHMITLEDATGGDEVRDNNYHELDTECPFKSCSFLTFDNLIQRVSKLKCTK